MSQILMKRGLKADLPLLAPGEPAWTTDTHEFFVGSDNGNIQISTSTGVSIKTYPYSGTFASDTSSFDLASNLPIYKDGDSVMVYIGGLLKTEDVNYELTNGIITKLDDGTGTDWPTGFTYDIIVLKNVDALDPDDPWIDGGTF